MKIKIWVYTWDVESETDSMVFETHAEALAKIMETAHDHYASEYWGVGLQQKITALEMELYNGANPAEVEDKFNELTESLAGFWGDDYHAINEAEVALPDWVYNKLLSRYYTDEFESIDGITQHPEGLNFDQWLLARGYK